MKESHKVAVAVWGIAGVVAGLLALRWYWEALTVQATASTAQVCRDMLSRSFVSCDAWRAAEPGPPLDPWDGPIGCEGSGVHALESVSYGADHRPGGSGRHSDVRCEPWQGKELSTCTCRVSAD